MNILFVCRYNRFRSRIAEAYFKKINRDSSIKVKSAGLIKGSPIQRKTILLLKKLNLDISGAPKGLSSKLLDWQDMVIIVADDVPKQVFNKNNKYSKKVLVWKIKDVKGNQDKEKIIIAKNIEKKVKEFVKQLEKR